MKKFLIILTLSFSFQPIFASDGVGFLEVSDKPSEVLLPKESLTDYFKRHAKKYSKSVVEGVKTAWNATNQGFESIHPDLSEEEENVSSPLKIAISSHHLGFREPSVAKESAPSDFAHAEALNEHSDEPLSAEHLASEHSAKTMTEKPFEKDLKKSEAKNNEEQIKKSKSLVKFFENLFDFSPELEPEEGDWDYKPVSAEELARLPDDHAALRIKPCALTPESHAKIAKIDAWLKSWSFLPIKTTMRLIFPIDKFESLISELNSSGTIPADVGERIEEITKNIRLLPDVMKRVTNAAAMTRVLSKEEALIYAGDVLPELSRLVHVAEDAKIAKQIWDQYPDDPRKALREIHELELETLKSLPIEKILKAVDGAEKGKVKAVEKTKKISGIITSVAIMLFAMTLGSLVLSIIEGVTDNKAIKKVMEALMIIDIAAIISGIGYGTIRLGQALNKKSAKDTDSIDEVPVAPIMPEDEDFAVI
ncbi:hypothetical protein KBB68_01225 [Candidatus Babeliales bacterium]|nr:hypothetical protein [Candidatus Babeliales bacterium]